MSEAVTNAAPAVDTPAPSTEGNNTPVPQTDANSAVTDKPTIEQKLESGEKLTKKELKEYRLKLDGKEKVVKFDPSNDEEMVKYLQKAEAADARFREASEVRKAAMQFIDELKKNPRKVLADPNIGVDLKKFATEIMNDELAELEKPEEQRVREKLQRELDDLKKQAQEKEEAFKQAEFARLQSEQERELEAGISAALDVGGVPKTPRTVARMAEMMMIALQNGIDLTPQDVVPLVKNNTMSEFKEVIGALSDDQLEDFLGKEVLSRLRKKNVAKAKAIDTANSIKSVGQEKSKEKSTPASKMTIRQFLGA